MQTDVHFNRIHLQHLFNTHIPTEKKLLCSQTTSLNGTILLKMRMKIDLFYPGSSPNTQEYVKVNNHSCSYLTDKRISYSKTTYLNCSISRSRNDGLMANHYFFNVGPIVKLRFELKKSIMSNSISCQSVHVYFVEKTILKSTHISARGCYKKRTNTASETKTEILLYKYLY